jgi:hypothetical protein
MALPEKVVLSAIEYRVQEHEGLIVFTAEAGFWGTHTRLAFEQHDGCWWVSFSETWGKVMVSHLIEAYRIIREEYGVNHADGMGARGEAAFCLRRAFRILSDMALCDSAPRERGLHESVESAVRFAEEMGWGKFDG